MTQSTTDVFHARHEADKAHMVTREGHTVTTETGVRCGLTLVRRICSCGWSGEWRKTLQ